MRHVPDAVEFRTLRLEPAVQSALRDGADRPGDRRACGHRHSTMTEMRAPDSDSAPIRLQEMMAAIQQALAALYSTRSAGVLSASGECLKTGPGTVPRASICISIKASVPGDTPKVSLCESILALCLIFSGIGLSAGGQALSAEAARKGLTQTDPESVGLIASAAEA